jgi:hypothetical protein
MADLKISALPAATTPLAGTEVVPLVQSATTKKVTVSDLTAGRDTSFKTGTATPRNGAIPTAGSVLNGLTIFNDQDAAIGDGVALFLDHSFRTPGSQSRGVRFSSYSTTAFAGFVGAKLQLTSSGSFFEAVDFQDNGNVRLSTGNLIIGTSGKGIDFSATPGTGTSELLADYEEGTWTPTDGSGAGLVLTVSSARYTKVGRVVTLQVKFTYPATASVSGAGITSLPFAPSSDCSGSYYSGTTAGATLFASGVMFFANSAGGGVTNAVLSGQTVIFSMTYSV